MVKFWPMGDTPRRLLCSCGEQSSEALLGDPIIVPRFGEAPGDCPALVESRIGLHEEENQEENINYACYKARARDHEEAKD